MKKLEDCLINKNNSCIPIWFMRQAGRYLPEFRKIRLENKDFIKLCLDSNLSSEITLQPLVRFDLDAAIIFSDILMTPYSLGQQVKFIKDEGPKLSDFDLNLFLQKTKEEFTLNLKPIYEAIKITKKKLQKEKSLISFIGAPWTLLIYMLGIKDKNNKLDLSLLKNKNLDFEIVLNKLVEYLKIHIKNQKDAGADVIQIFDSWAGLVPINKLNDFCYNPNLKIVEFCKEIKLPTICFPKGLKENYCNFLEIVKPDGLNIDYDIAPNWAKQNLKNVCLQGGMDPKILFEEEKIIFNEVDKYLNTFRGQPYIFNLGHGILPKTNPDVLKKVVERVKLYKC